ncbi:MAG TPA: hypothetical protein VEK39_15150 [Solirubrobacterales bacterium]|nr:hypothetical protein [Solirubrobacterales bacterium]
MTDEVVACPGQRPERAGLVAVGFEDAVAVHVGAGELGEHVGVEAVRLAAAGAVAVAGGRQLVRVHGHDRDPRLEQPIDDQAVRPLDRDSRHLQLEQAADQRPQPGLAVADPLLFELASVAVDDDQPVLLARQVDPSDALHTLTSLIGVAGCGPTGEVPWRMLIDGPSAGRRPVAAPGASHGREAQVSRGPSTGQAPRALSRPWSATSRRYEPRRSTPAITACGRTLRFQRTRRTKDKVDQ